MTVPSVSRNAVPPFAFDKQKMIEISVHTRHTIASTTVASVQTIEVTIPKATHTSVMMTAQMTQNSQDHQLHSLVVSHAHWMHFTSVLTAHVRHSVRNTRPYSAQRNHVSVTLRVQLSGSSFQVPFWKSPLAIVMTRGPARSPYRTAEA